jgi:hypothetical protein
MLTCMITVLTGAHLHEDPGQENGEVGVPAYSTVRPAWARYESNVRLQVMVDRVKFLVKVYVIAKIVLNLSIPATWEVLFIFHF